MSKMSDKWTLKTRWVMRRNAMLGSGRFQKWAAHMPIFRGISRRYAAAQFDLVAGFVYSQILAAYVETGLLDYLNGQLRTLEEVVKHSRLGNAATERLLRAGQALQLSESPQIGLWTLGKAGAPMSVNAGAMAMVRHHQLFYRDIADPVKLLSDDRQQQTALSSYWTYASRQEGAGDTAGYSALMAATQPMVLQQILPAYRFSDHARMLDIGGGSGSFASAVKAVNPILDVGIFDLPEVIAEAKNRRELGGNAKAIQFHEGSFKVDPLPGGYDLITLIRILHDHDDDVVESLLAKIHAILPAGGRLLIAEPMAESAGAERMGGAYFGLYLWAMGSGRPRSQSEYRSMLEKAGFSSIRTIKTDLPIITSALVAFR